MRVALITGCSSGFGLLSALAFARRGNKVYATMRDLSKDGDLQSITNSEQLPIIILKLDVTDDHSVKQAVSKVLDKEGRIDVLVNNAGMGCLGSVEFLSDTMLRTAFETNFFGVIRMLRAVLPAMRAQGSGTIVNVSSIDGRIPGKPINWGYAASKHSLGVLSDALALEVEPFGIKVRQIEPGFFATKILTNRKLLEKENAAANDERSDVDSPYRKFEEAVRGFAEGNMQHSDDPQIVAEAIIEAVNTEAFFPVHYPVGEEANATLKEIATLDEEQQALSWKKMMGL
ncbi:NADP-dependent 3-hydroxy acid dehydrogenase YdfG [Scopulibacillus darangshiensis]|uniref:NADP-dependent 3-hydroxy acid dehydrogenase YdfG n=1 Tax=Scopulibacillus darangshiensis TaxID=442528 RepID=A0A4R2P7H9_9BACL|nr:SDR family oxidoreductase [Scopulibacillus darangshiensis]TCP30890.1 NADP-dependent 3-hydroxy acid dehydrogenase YdfG [Scopulibacillus darangshiensis]